MVAGVTLAPGQALDPVNDMVEQFGDMMLAASVAFGIMHFLIQIGGFWLFSLALSAAATAWLALTWKKLPMPGWLPKALVVLLLVRFTIPIMMVGSDLVFKQFLAPEYTASQEGIQIGTNEVTTFSNRLDEGNAQAEHSEEPVESVATVEGVAPLEDAEEWKVGWMSAVINKVANGANKLKEKLSTAKQKVVEAIDFKARIKHLEESAERLVKNMINIIVIFIIQTIIVPVAIMWLLYLLGLNAIRSINHRESFSKP